MNILERMKMELLHKDYFTDEEYTIFLQEEGLTPTDEYNKEQHKRKMLLAILSVFRALQNDTDSYKKLSDGVTQFSQSASYKYIAERIQALEDEIATLPVPEDEDVNSDVFMFFRRG